jgi:serine/threonine protein phosphatase PrpC
MIDTTYRRPITWQSSAITHEGMVRPINEDAILNKPQISLWAVADGMGGHKVGDIASKKIVSALDTLEHVDRLSEAVDIIEDCLTDVNQLMIEYAQLMLEGHTMGSTLVCAVIKGRIGACLWVGDSRLYRFRNNKLEQLSRDHSQLEEMIELGLITREDSENHPNKNIITRAIGVEPQLFVDVTLFSTQVGDTYLLCSDGIYNAISDQQIIESLTLKNVEESTEKLLTLSLENHARDNVSAIVVKGCLGRVPSSITCN